MAKNDFKVDENVPSKYKIHKLILLNCKVNFKLKYIFTFLLLFYHKQKNQKNSLDDLVINAFTITIHSFSAI